MKTILVFILTVFFLFLSLSCEEESSNYQWQSELVITGNPTAMDMALDSADNPQIVYVQNPDKLVRVAAGNGNGFNIMTVPDIGGNGCMEPSIAVDSQDHLHVAFMG